MLGKLVPKHSSEDKKVLHSRFEPFHRR
jgi:hypothetical protein